MLLKQHDIISAHPDIRKRLKKNGKLDSSDLLKLLSVTLARDSSHLTFDHRTLAISCWRILDGLENEYLGRLRHSRHFFFRGDEERGEYNVVDEILWDLAILAKTPWAERSLLERMRPSLERLIRDHNGHGT